MPTTAFIVSRHFADEQEADDQLYVDEAGAAYWSQGRLQEADVLIAVSVQEFARQLVSFLDTQPAQIGQVAVTLEWGDICLDAQENLFAAYSRFAFAPHNPGEVLRSLRKEAAEKTGERISQGRVARETALDSKTISLLELGKVQHISARAATALARYYSRVLSRRIGSEDLGYPVLQPRAKS